MRPYLRYYEALRRLAARREARAVAAVAVLLGVFTLLLFAVRGTLLPGWDLALTLELQHERSRWLDRIFKLLTTAGGFLVLAPVGIVVALLYWRQRLPRTALLVGLAGLLGHPLDSVIKLLARRPRPTEDAVEVIMAAGGTSFPSGHAMATLFFAGFLATLVWARSTDARIRIAAVALAVLYVVGVGVSRVYVGGHWASDVLGGWVCGLVLLVAWIEMHRFWAKEA